MNANKCTRAFPKCTPYKSKSGGGLLSYEVWGFREKGRTVVTRYNLAYINDEIFRGDNGRVLGFDNAHGRHHRHFMGVVSRHYPAVVLFLHD